MADYKSPFILGGHPNSDVELVKLPKGEEIKIKVIKTKDAEYDIDDLLIGMHNLIIDYGWQVVDEE